MIVFKRTKVTREKFRRSILLLLVISGTIISLSYILILPSLSEEMLSNGRINFSGRGGDPLSGVIEISGTGMPNGHQDNVSSISWNMVPNARIGFSAFDTKNISVNFRINGDSLFGNVIIEDFGLDRPESVTTKAPGEPVKYWEINAMNVYFTDANVTIQYTDTQIGNIDENSLTLYIFDRAQEVWKELPATLDTQNNTLSTGAENLIFDNTRSKTGTYSGKIIKLTAGEQVQFSSNNADNNAGTTLPSSGTQYKYGGCVYIERGASADIFFFSWNSADTSKDIHPITSCIYCHNDTKHNSSALGRPALWKGNNVVNGSINTSNWCSSCHYRGYSSGGKNYASMTSAFISSNLSVPPEITNGTYAPFNRSRYYNHSLTNAMNNTPRPDRFVDPGMYNTSLHRSLTCENCHTKGHKNIGARRACEDCHVVQANPVSDKDRHNITETPGMNMYNGESVVNITDCAICHDSALLNNSRNTYGYGKSKDCDYCHTYPDKEYK